MKKIQIILFLAVVSLSLQAQSVSKDSTNVNRVLTLEREYNPVLDDASKINLLPDVKEPAAPKSQVEYSGYTIPYIVPPYLRTLTPNSYFTELSKNPQRGYLNLGVSHLLNIDGDAGYQLINNNEDFLNIYFSHRSAWSEVAYLQNNNSHKMNINDNYGGLNFRHDFEKIRINARAKYTYSAYNYYGNPIFPPSASSVYPPKEDPASLNIDKNTNQANNMFEIYAGAQSKQDEGLRFKINGGYTYFRQQYGYLLNSKGRRENRFLIDADFFTGLNSTTIAGIAGYVKSYNYEAPADPLRLLDLVSAYPKPFDRVEKRLGNYNYVVLSGNPYLNFEGNQWNVRLGLSANLQLGALKQFVIAPDVRVQWNPMSNFLFYFLAQGGFHDNSNYDSYYENRYIDPAFRIHDSASPLDATIGIDFSAMSNLNIGLFTGYKLTNNEHFFIADHNLPDSTGNYRFLSGQRIVPLYAQTQTFKAGGTLKYKYQDIWDMGLKITYNHWNIKDIPYITNYDALSETFESIAWNKPQWVTELNIGAQVIPSLPLHFNLLYRAELGRKAWVSCKTFQMKDIHDLSIQGVYTIQPSFSIYATVSNLLFQKYDFWYGYPAQNFNVMGGISIKF